MDLSSSARRKSARLFTDLPCAWLTVAAAFASTALSTSHTAATSALAVLANVFASTVPRPFRPITQTTTLSLGEPLAKSGTRGARSPSAALDTVFTKRRRFIVASL